MNNFNPMGYLNRLVTNIVQNQIRPQNEGNPPAQNFANNLMPNNPQKQPLAQKTLSPELKLTPMEVEQTAKYVKELLNLPKDISQAISQMSSNTAMTTAQNVQLLMLLSSGKLDLNQMAQLLNDNSKAALQKLVQTMSEAMKMGVKDVSQLKDMMNMLGLVSTSVSDPSSALKNFILVYLPWLPLNSAGENRDFDIDVFDKTASEESSDELESITILIQTVNFSNIKALLELAKDSQVEIMLNCPEEFPKERVMSILKKDSQDLNIKTGLIIETSKKEIPKNTVEKARAQITSSSSVSPQLVLMAHAVIKTVFKVDKDFAIIK